MKILLLAPHPFFQDRGTPIAVNHILRVLSERLDEVDVLTYHEGRDIVHPGVVLHRISSPPFVHNVLPGYSFKKLVCDLVMLFTALRLMRRNQYELIHAVEESVFIALLLKSLYRVPYVYDMDSSLAQQMVEQMPWLRPLTGLFTWFEGTAVRRAEVVVPVCDALADGIRHYQPKKVVTLHDVSLLEESESQPCSDDLRQWLGLNSLLIMYVGNLQPYQGIDLLLEGFQLTLEKQRTADLIIIGGAKDDIDKYQKMAQRLGVSPQVHFIGPRPVKNLSAYLAQADILVSPRIKGNNTPMKIYSYLHSGKPLLATDLPTHTQLVNSESAVLVAPNAVAWSKGLLMLIEDADLRTRIGMAGRYLIETQFSYPVFSGKLNMLLDWLLASLDKPQAEILCSSK